MVLPLSVSMVVSTINLPLKKIFLFMCVLRWEKNFLMSLNIMFSKELPLCCLLKVNYSFNNESKNFYLFKIKLSWNHHPHFPTSRPSLTFTLSQESNPSIVPTPCALASPQGARGGQSGYVRSEALRFIKLFNTALIFTIV